MPICTPDAPSAKAAAIPRASDIDDRGDMNLNGVAYEIADAVLYTNYFIFGPSAFDLDPIRRESQIAASDVNADGSPLTVADLVYLIRVILGLEDPIAGDGALPRVANSGSAEVSWLAGAECRPAEISPHQRSGDGSGYYFLLGRPHGDGQL